MIFFSDNTIYHAENAEEINVNKIPLKKHKCSNGIKNALGIAEVVSIAEVEETMKVQFMYDKFRESQYRETRY